MLVGKFFRNINQKNRNHYFSGLSFNSLNVKKNNIFFAGIDFISGKLNGDINVTSPTGLKTHFELSGNNLAKKFWNELK